MGNDAERPRDQAVLTAIYILTYPFLFWILVINWYLPVFLAIASMRMIWVLYFKDFKFVTCPPFTLILGELAAAAILRSEQRNVLFTYTLEIVQVLKPLKIRCSPLVFRT